ncbi:MAG: hypothetical protein OEZ47_10585, partial [Gammaproteobacteria bacterium]|nr:hypothetical protein [Gammaproteobacteria bacterium]
MNKKALVVESSKTFRIILEEMLSEAGIDARIFESGKDALEATHEEYSVMLVARTLGDISGEIFLELFS